MNYYIRWRHQRSVECGAAVTVKINASENIQRVIIDIRQRPLAHIRMPQRSL